MILTVPEKFLNNGFQITILIDSCFHHFVRFSTYFEQVMNFSFCQKALKQRRFAG